MPAVSSVIDARIPSNRPSLADRWRRSSPSAAGRRRAHRPALLVLAAAVACLTAGDAARCQEPAGPPPLKVSGYLVSTLGNPIRGCRVQVSLDRAYPPFQVIQDVSSDYSGYYEFETSEYGCDIIVWPYDGTWEVRASPDARLFQGVTSDVQQDFTISPGVRVRVHCGWSYPSPAGTEVFVDGTRVTTITDDGTCMAVFYPDDYLLPHTGEIWFDRPFTAYTPQDDGGLNHYDCRNAAIFASVDELQWLAVDADERGVYSWDDPGGLGWEVFPATPDNRLPNNPDVVVEVDFNTVGAWPREYLRLNGVHPDDDLTEANGHIARFAYPIQDCSRGSYGVEVYFERGSGFGDWWPLAGAIASGTSDADLDGNGVLNISDIGYLNLALGTCDGDAGWLPCADYSANGCIGIDDCGYFSEIYYTGAEKAAPAGPLEAEILLVPDGKTGCACVVDTDLDWAFIVARFSVAGTTGGVTYVPADGYADRAILVPHSRAEATDYEFYVLGGGSAGRSPLGTFLGGAETTAADLVVQSVQVVAAGPVAADEKALRVEVPRRTGLAGIWPNPFNPTTTISFILVERTPVRLGVYDVSGRLVRQLRSGEALEAGRHDAAWDGNDGAGRKVGAGVYICRLDAGGVRDTRRVTLLK